VLQTIVDTSLSSMVFTTDDLIHYRTTTAGAGPDDWPSAAQLVALGKRVVIFNDAEDRSGLEGCDGCKPPLQFQMTAEWGWPNLEGFVASAAAAARERGGGGGGSARRPRLCREWRCRRHRDSTDVLSCAG
jgi:hypothetical protein